MNVSFDQLKLGWKIGFLLKNFDCSFGFVDYICSWYLRFGCQGLFRVLKVWVPRFVPGTYGLGA